MNNFYKEKLLAIFDKDVVDNYVNFLETCTDDFNLDFTESHHILPKSLFPEYRHTKDNLIRLSPFNHFKAHYYLSKSNNKQMLYAFNMMNRAKRYFTENELDEAAKLYEEQKLTIYKMLSEERKGKRLSPEVYKKIADKRRGNIVVTEKSTNKTVVISTKEYKQNKHLYIHSSSGRKHSDETKQKMSANGIKNKTAYHHKETGKTIYVDEETFNDENYIKGAGENPWPKEYFTGTTYWFNPETNQTKRQVESPGEGWINGRLKFDNYFANNIQVISLLTGKTEFIQKESRRNYHIAPAKICYVIENRVYFSTGDLVKSENIKDISKSRLEKLLLNNEPIKYDIKRLPSKQVITEETIKHLEIIYDTDAIKV